MSPRIDISIDELARSIYLFIYPSIYITPASACNKRFISSVVTIDGNLW